MQVEAHHDFPNVWQAALILCLLIGIQIVIAAGFYDAGARFEQGDPEYSGLIVVLSCGVVFALLLSYKNIGYRNLFHPGRQAATLVVRYVLIPIVILAV